MMDLFDILAVDDDGKHHPFKLKVKEDNKATILIAKEGYSQKMRDYDRVHRVNLSSLKDLFDQKETYSIDYVETDKQAADIFTKALTPMKWPNALRLLGINTKGKYTYDADDGEWGGTLDVQYKPADPINKKRKKKKKAPPPAPAVNSTTVDAQRQASAAETVHSVCEDASKQLVAAQDPA